MDVVHFIYADNRKRSEYLLAKLDNPALPGDYRRFRVGETTARTLFRFPVHNIDFSLELTEESSHDLPINKSRLDDLAKKSR